jgi:hypothetical protein
MDFFAHFLVPPGPFKKLGLLPAGSPKIYLKKCAKRAHSGWPNIVCNGGQRKKTSIYKNDFFKVPNFLRDDPKNFNQDSGSYLRPNASPHLLF